jgi:phenylacetic acid degradation operon negative regulatory protein
MRPSPTILALLDRFQAKKPVRAWSLIVTLYGDAIVPRGGSLWLGSLIDIMGLFGIDAGHVRTAMSRLTSDGWLARARSGRNSYYRLSRRGEKTFATATQRIYFAASPSFEGRLQLALLGPGADDRSTLRSALEKAGFMPLSRTVYVGLTDPPPALLRREGLFLLKAETSEVSRAIAAAAWQLSPIADGYRAFIEQFTALGHMLERGVKIEHADALVARTLLIHEFRRIVLRDPALPTPLLPGDWPGGRARALAGRIYRSILPAAECFLDAHARNEKGALPPPGPDLAARFGEPH